MKTVTITKSIKVVDADSAIRALVLKHGTAKAAARAMGCDRVAFDFIRKGLLTGARGSKAVEAICNDLGIDKSVLLKR